MCGIAGIYNFKVDCPPDRALLESMTDVLEHRGPDDRGFFVSGSIGLGIRRLSIIDLAGGAQPIGNEDGNIQVVCNGEIYNHRDLRRDLESRGHHFRTKSDTEVLVHGYEEFGIGVLEKLNGMFGFALWDNRNRTLLLARDRIGIKPLYFAETPDGLVFASELKSILLVAKLQKELDGTALRQYFAWEYIPAPRTPFRNISKLRPAAYLLVSEKGVQLRSYWHLKCEPTIEDPREAVEGLQARLKRSVRLRLEADVPVGAFLSGGLDSSGIVAMLRTIGKEKLHTFSIGFGEAAFNETRYARDVADTFGTWHKEEILRPNCVQLVEDVAKILDEPFADNSILPTYLVSRLARRDVKVVLTGDGGDELFGGYDHYKADRLSKWYQMVPDGLRSKLNSWIGKQMDAAITKKGSWRRRLHRLEEALSLPSSLEHARWMVRTTEHDNRPLLKYVGNIDMDSWMEPFVRAFNLSPFSKGLTRQLDVDLHTFLPDDILYKVDRASMATGLEARVPYLDHEVVEYAFRIPDRWKLRLLSGKWILRKMLRHQIPRSTLLRRKSGFSVPVGAWLKGSLREMACDLLDESRLKRQGIFDEKNVKVLLEEHLNDCADRSRTLWSLIMFQQWWDRYYRSGSVRVTKPPFPNRSALRGEEANLEQSA